MRPTIERKLVMALGIWQILDGVITIIFYGLFKRHQFSQLSALTYQNAEEMDSLFSSSFIIISIFGTILIGLGLFNLVVAKRYLKNQAVSLKWIMWLLTVAVFSLFVMDIVSVVLASGSVVSLFAKRSAIKKIKLNEYSRSL